MTAHNRSDDTAGLSTPGFHGAEHFEIVVRGHLPARWSAWFDGLELTTSADGTTAITGPIVDQAALHGLLERLRDLGIPLVSVTPITPDNDTDSERP